LMRSMLKQRNNCDFRTKRENNKITAPSLSVGQAKQVQMSEGESAGGF